MHVRAVKGRRRKGATSYLSTPRLPRHCRPAGIQFDWSELSVSRGLFPVARHGVRGCKAVNLSALIETTADEGNDRGATIPSTARRRGILSSPPLLFSHVYLVVFLIFSRIRESATCIFVKVPRAAPAFTPPRKE